MIQLNLNKQEQEALTISLDSYLSNMSYEIATTDKMEFRDTLKNQARHPDQDSG